MRLKKLLKVIVLSVGVSAITTVASAADLSSDQAAVISQKIKAIGAKWETLGRLQSAQKDASAGNRLRAATQGMLLVKKETEFSMLIRQFPLEELKDAVEAGKPTAMILWSQFYGWTSNVQKEAKIGDKIPLLQKLSKQLLLRRSSGVPINVFAAFEHLDEAHFEKLLKTYESGLKPMEMRFNQVTDALSSAAFNADRYYGTIAHQLSDHGSRSVPVKYYSRTSDGSYLTEADALHSKEFRTMGDSISVAEGRSIQKNWTNVATKMGAFMNEMRQAEGGLVLVRKAIQAALRIF